MSKVELRREMRRRLAAGDEARAGKSRAIAAAIAAHEAFARARCVALFSPLPSEPDVESLWEKGGHVFCYPRVGGGEIEFVGVSMLAELAPAPWHAGIREPSQAAKIVDPASIDLILVPGLAFTPAGQRLGRGGGFYDRFLARLPASATKLGVCFSLQLVSDIPDEPHDQRVHAVITERGLASPSG